MDHDELMDDLDVEHAHYKVGYGVNLYLAGREDALTFFHDLEVCSLNVDIERMDLFVAAVMNMAGEKIISVLDSRSEPFMYFIGADGERAYIRTDALQAFKILPPDTDSIEIITEGADE